MRRLRAGEDVSLALGRPGVTVRAHYGALPLSGWTGADDGWRKPVRWQGTCQLPVPGSTVPRPKTVAVARRQALRGSGLPAIRQAGAASETTPRAWRRAASPHVFEGRPAHTSDAQAPRECERMFSDITGLFDMLIRQRRAGRCAPSLKPRSGEGRGGAPHVTSEFAEAPTRLAGFAADPPSPLRAAVPRWGREKKGCLSFPSPRSHPRSRWFVSPSRHAGARPSCRRAESCRGSHFPAVRRPR